MEWFLIDPNKYDRYYNCNLYSVEEIPLEQRRHVWLGIGFMTLTTVYQLLYIPCMFSIWKHMVNSYCYRIMFYIGVVDMITMVVNGWMTGYLGYIGAVYCTSPRLIYISGAVGLGCWCAESSMEVVLALNRCIELWSNELANKLFKGKKLCFWLGIPTLYGLYFVFFTPPVIFTGIYFAWFFNPHVGYINDPENVYENIPHTIHNNVLLCILIITYLIFCAILFIKAFGHLQSNNQDQRGFSQKMIFFQVLLISAINAVAAAIYVYMNYFHINDALIVLGQFCWLNAHGIPPVIYLTMNKSIQRDCKAMFYNIKGTRVSIHPSTGVGSIIRGRS